jgi:uncharacterized membrane protein YdjX (TVP38/TMEM64 family)
MAMKRRNKQLVLLLLFIALIVALRYSPLGSLLTFENLKHSRGSLLAVVRAHYWLSVAAYVVLYAFATALSVPGAVILTLAGGFLYGVVAATIYVNVGATCGAALAFLSARYLLGNRLQEKYREPLLKFNREFDKNGARYLLTVRFIPVFPFFLINFLSGLTRVPLGTFVWTTSLGIIPGTAVFAYAGGQLGSINALSEVLSARIFIAFGVLALFILFPVFLNRKKKMDA